MQLIKDLKPYLQFLFVLFIVAIASYTVVTSIPNRVMAENTNNVKLGGVFISNNKIPQKQAYFIPAITQYLKSEAPGKRVLDIGCGTGD